MPLSGIRVLDMGRAIAGPWCTQMLGDLGAEIIKIELRGRGDEIRYYGPPFVQDADGQDLPISAYFLSANRNKRSIALDIRKEGARKIIEQLAGQCHVMLENFKVGDLQRYRLDYESIRKINPEIIYCSITGFGQTGPYRKRPGTDYVFQAMSGLMSVTGEPDGEPQKVGVVISDLLTGLNAAIAILAAVRHREVHGGPGQHIDMALLDTTIASMSHRALEYLMSGVLPQRIGNKSPGSAPAQIFDCADGKINLQASTEPKYRQLCTLLDRPDLASDPRFQTRADRFKNIAVLEPELARTIGRWRTADLYAALVDAQIVCSPVYNVEQAFADEQVQHRRLRREIRMGSGEATPIVANPIVFSETPITDYRLPPTIGQHTVEILRELLGYRDDQIAALKAEESI